jgi:pyruvate,water dikinase
MRKACAIITNEGGLACHAAIISRELGLPAIIGTRNATNVLKNGDEIEMNMKTGEIKIHR